MKPLHLVMAVLVAAVWGFNFVAIHVGLASVPPILMASLRFAIAALPALVVPRPRIPWRHMAAISALLFVAQFAFLFTGMAHGMPPGLTSVVQQVQAFYTSLLAIVLLRERPSAQQVLGMVVAFAGLAVIATTIGGGGDATLIGFGLTMAASLSWAGGNIMLRKVGRVDMFALIVWLSVLPPLPLLGLSLLLEGPAAIAGAAADANWLGVAAVVYNSVFSTWIGYGLWGHLLKLYPATTVAPFSLLVPIFGMASAALLMGEHFSPLRLAGIGLIFLGLAATALSLRRLRPAAATRPTGEGCLTDG